MQTNNPKLGVIYDVESLKAALNSKPLKKGYVSVGLIFKEIVEKELVLETLYFSNSKEDAFSSKPLISNKIKKFISSKKNLNGKTDSTFNYDSSEGQMRIKNESSFQFWEVMNNLGNGSMKPLVYFSRNDLELLFAGEVKTITFSGAQIDYGIGLRNFEEEALDSENKSAYPTLKAESNLNNNKEGPLIPNVALALPCPPIWEEDDDEHKNYENIDITNRILSSVKRNYSFYSEDTPRSFDIVKESDSGAILNNWVHFLNNQ